jgi:NAD(P)-dependent dehydrogenase (short-subunit alcohol dehydrogenase family)
MQLKDQAAIVTGGASGLGAATARRLAAQGAKVAVCDLNATLAETVAAEIGGVAVICDVSDAASAEAAIAKAAAAHGPARVLVNCAGIGVAKRVIGKEGPMALGDFEKVIKVNLIGSFNMLRLATAGMSKLEPLATGERGVVISTASVAAYDGQIGQSAYSASKGGIVAMTLPIARELAQFGIRVLTIAPGLFLTPLLANLPQEAQDSLAAAIPFPRRLGHADEFASLALHMIDNPYLIFRNVRRFDLDHVRSGRFLEAGHHPQIRPGRHTHGGYAGEIPHSLDPWRLDQDRKPDRELQAVLFRGGPQRVQGRGVGDRGVRDPRAGRQASGRPREAEIGADAAGDHRAIHAGLTQSPGADSVPRMT